MFMKYAVLQNGLHMAADPAICAQVIQNCESVFNKYHGFPAESLITYNLKGKNSTQEDKRIKFAIYFNSENQHVELMHKTQFKLYVLQER